MSFGLGQATAGASGCGTGLPGTAAASISNVDSSTPWVAAADGNLPALQHALQVLHLPVTATDEEQGYTLLQAAASYSQMPVLQWLVSQAAQLQSLSTPSSNTNSSPLQAFANAVDKDGDSALHYASTVTAVRFLVEHTGTDVHIRNAAGLTALEAKQQELIELMLDQDTEDDDVDVVNLKESIPYLEALGTREQ